MKKIIVFVSLFFVFSSCNEIKTDDPTESYEMWVKSNSNEKINVLNGKYWQSSHWSLEYLLFLEVKNDNTWWSKFKKENDLIIDTSEFNLENVYERPNWFKPNINSIKYKYDSEFDQGARYFEDTINNKIFVYDIQL